MYVLTAEIAYEETRVIGVVANLDEARIMALAFVQEEVRDTGAASNWSFYTSSVSTSVQYAGRVDAPRYLTEANDILESLGL